MLVSGTSSRPRILPGLLSDGDIISVSEATRLLNVSGIFNALESVVAET